jgi:hypothetical protein
MQDNVAHRCTGQLVRALVGGRHVQPEPGVKPGLCLNTAICVIRVEDQKGRLLKYGDILHLQKEAVQHNADAPV